MTMCPITGLCDDMLNGYVSYNVVGSILEHPGICCVFNSAMLDHISLNLPWTGNASIAIVHRSPLLHLLLLFIYLST